MEKKDFISEDEWVKLFTHIVTTSKVEFIAMRLVDRKVKIEGGDVKDSKAFGSSSLEGLQFLTDDPVGKAIALAQIKAAMRVNAVHGHIGVMFPMVSNYQEWQKACL